MTLLLGAALLVGVLIGLPLLVLVLWVCWETRLGSIIGGIGFAIAGGWLVWQAVLTENVPLAAAGEFALFVALMCIYAWTRSSMAKY